ncbi:glycoside hydrolase family 18 protein [Crucibulum laeve]|uniref:Glycoside hydrolase family 18 protein n=1 Tax=Crucibulum laeve TaxID=68775 RepID=A0A5C3M872_9AGAR|nr:glycoside hydrolase family 18 protein [Crucibulum laeve]
MTKLLFLTLLATCLSCALARPFNSSLHMRKARSLGRRANTTPVATAWYPGWYGSKFPPAQISWEKYTQMTFAFALTTPDTSVISLDADSQKILPDFVTEAKNHNVSSLLSIGGWTGSQYFSSAVASASNRTIFVKSVVNLATKYKLDGIDFDWEYPNKQGVGCNLIADDDSANFLSFLQELRKDPVGSKLILSAAVSISPFAGVDGTPMKDVSEFSKVLDHIAIMNYDIWGAFSPTVGPNSPLDDTCSPTPAGSAVSAIKAWTSAGFPANQIALGVASYAHTFHVAPSAAINSNGTLALYPAFDKALQPAGDGETTGMTGVDQCGVATGPSGLFDFSALVSNGFLDKNGTAASGLIYSFDECSQTPFLYNKSTQVMVSYDDATSFAAKGKFIKNSGLAGFAMWHVAGDSNDILVNSINKAIDAAGSTSTTPTNGSPSLTVAPTPSSTATTKQCRRRS